MARDYRPVHDNCRCRLCVPGTIPPPRPDDWKYQVRFRAFGDRGFGLEEFLESWKDVPQFFDDYILEARKGFTGFLMSVTPRGGEAINWKKIPCGKDEAREGIRELIDQLRVVTR